MEPPFWTGSIAVLAADRALGPFHYGESLISGNRPAYWTLAYPDAPRTHP